MLCWESQSSLERCLGTTILTIFTTNSVRLRHTVFRYSSCLVWDSGKELCPQRLVMVGGKRLKERHHKTSWSEPHLLWSSSSLTWSFSPVWRTRKWDSSLHSSKLVKSLKLTWFAGATTAEMSCLRASRSTALATPTFIEDSNGSQVSWSNLERYTFSLSKNELVSSGTFTTTITNKIVDKKLTTCLQDEALSSLSSQSPCILWTSSYNQLICIFTPMLETIQRQQQGRTSHLQQTGIRPS